MPRANKGGVVQGTVGKPYPNRTDLQRAVPTAVAPNQEYGKRAEQQAAQRSIPVSGPPGGAPSVTPPAPQGAPAGPPAPAPVGGNRANAFPPPPPQGPGVLPFLHPSNRPNEPVTAGLATGPGPGPEALTGVGAIAQNGSVEQGTLKNLLGSLASAPVSSAEIRDLAAVAGAG